MMCWEKYLTRLLERDQGELFGDYFCFSGGANFLMGMSL